MARQTRAQRRARREARLQQPEQAARPHGNGPQSSEVQRRPAPVEQPQRERRDHGGPFRFVRESWGELQKVEWPTQNQLVQGTVVVLIACVIVGIYLWGADQVFRRLVQQVFLGQ